MAAGFHPYTHPDSSRRQFMVKTLRLLTMLQPSFLQLSSVGIHRSNLLKLGVEIYSYNDHRSAPFSRAVGWLQHHQLYSGVGADIVMESITLIDLVVSVNADFDS
jgi:hypothetical protein